jgi:hypothetical protein
MMVAIATTVRTSILAEAYVLNESQCSITHRSCAKIREVQVNLNSVLTCAKNPEYTYSTYRHLCCPVPVGQMKFFCSYRLIIWLQSKLKLKKKI